MLCGLFLCFRVKWGAPLLAVVARSGNRDSFRRRNALAYCAVSVNVATGCPSPYGPSAVTVTICAVEGSVNVTCATPELLVTAIIFGPLVVPFETVPALVENSTLAPVFVPPDDPGFNVTDSVNCVPTPPV